jgi:hypothetical protein
LGAFVSWPEAQIRAASVLVQNGFVVKQMRWQPGWVEVMRQRRF